MLTSQLQYTAICIAAKNSFLMKHCNTFRYLHGYSNESPMDTLGAVYTSIHYLCFRAKMIKKYPLFVMQLYHKVMWVAMHSNLFHVMSRKWIVLKCSDLTTCQTFYKCLVT